MRARVAWAVVALSGCGVSSGMVDAGAPDVAGVFRFDVDVVVSDREYVWIWLREKFDTNCEPEEVFPHPGECAEYTDAFGCGPRPDFCVARAAVVHGERVLGETDDTYVWWHVFGFEAPGLFETPDSELVLDLCDGESLRVPLPSARAPAASVTDLETDGTTLQVRWGSDSAPTGAVGTLGFGYGGFACHDAPDGEIALEAPWYATWADLYITAVVGVEASATSRGVAHVWVRGGASSPIPIVLPRLDGDWFAIRLQESSIELDIDGFSSSRWSQALAYRPTAGGGRVRVSSGLLSYEAGETTDAISLLVDGELFTRSFPHVAPLDDLDFFFDGNDLFELSVGPITLANEVDPSRTHVVSFTMRARHSVIPRCIP